MIGSLVATELQDAAALAGSVHMTGIETKIFGALAARLDAFVSAYPIDVAYPNINFMPRPRMPYLRPWMLPAPTISASLIAPGSMDFKGIFQIDVFWPAGQGLIQALEKSAAIIAHFATTRLIYQDGFAVQINEAPYASPAMQEPGWVHIPVSIRFRAFA
jgi:hypothetical protein